MMAAELKATIRPDGTVEVDLELPPGAPCDAADDKIELAWAERHYARDEWRMTAERAANRAAVPAEIRDLQRDLAAAYRERALAAALRIAAGGQQVRRERGKDGSVILRVTVKGGA